jgi:fatty-acyl-CoA synthase
MYKVAKLFFNFKAEDLAAGLIATGLTKGDRVGVWAPNCPEWVITQYATALAGIIQVNINPAYRTSELEYSLKKVGCKALILSEQYKNSNYLSMLTEICPEIESSQPGHIKSKRLPEFQSAIVISNSQHKCVFSFT